MGQPISSLALMSENQLLAGDMAGEIVIWDIRDGKSTASFIKHSGIIHSLASSPNQWILSGSHHEDIEEEISEILLWNANTLEVKHTFKFEFEEATQVCFSNDGSLALCCAGSHQQIFNTTTGEVLFSLTYRYPVYGCFSVDDRFLLVGDASGVHKLDAQNMALIHTIELGVEPVTRVVSRSSQFAYVWDSFDIYEWDLNENQCVTLVENEGENVLQPKGVGDVSRDGRFLAYSTDSSEIVIFDIGARKETLRFQCDKAYVNDVIFHPNGQRVIIGYGNGAIVIWDMARQEQVLRLQRP